MMVLTEYIEMARAKHSSHVVARNTGPFAAILDKNWSYLQTVETTFVDET